MEPTLDPDFDINDSLQDYALLHEEHEGTLGPVKYAALTSPKQVGGHDHHHPKRYDGSDALMY